MGLLERSKAYEKIHAVVNEAGEGRVVVGHIKNQA
jgi:release factor glutamine methyltransferase